MFKKKVSIGTLSLLLVLIALIWSYNVFGFCLGDEALSIFNIPTWSNGSEQQFKNTLSIVTFVKNGEDIHYTVYYSLIFVIPALVLAIKNKDHLFADIGKWVAIIYILLLLISPLLVIKQ